MTNNKLAIISVVYENYTVLKDFLESLRQQTNQNFHLFLIDVSDKKQKMKITINNQQLTIIPELNRGYSYAVNIGLKQAIKKAFQYFCILNNDTYFQKDFIDKTFNSILHRPSSIIGGKIYYAPGYEFHKDRYTKSDLGKVIWFAGGKIDWNHVLTPHVGVDMIDIGQYNKTKEVDFVNGALMLFDKNVIDKTGFWDENYFLYFEDTDYCVRAKKIGLKLIYDPNIIIWHKNAQSTGGSGSIIHQKYQRINRLKFGLKYAPLKTKLHLLKNYVSNLLSFRA